MGLEIGRLLVGFGKMIFPSVDPYHPITSLGIKPLRIAFIIHVRLSINICVFAGLTSSLSFLFDSVSCCTCSEYNVHIDDAFPLFSFLTLFKTILLVIFLTSLSISCISSFDNSGMSSGSCGNQVSNSLYVNSEDGGGP